MFDNDLLRDDYTFEQAESLQIKYQQQIESQKENKKINNTKLIKIVVGTDISYYREDYIEYGVACAVVWNLNNRSIVETSFAREIIKFPYRPGFLGFRECKLLARVILKLKNKPELVICDGHGKIHSKRFGEAVQLGYALNLPTVGVAKNPFVGYSNWETMERIKSNKTPVWAFENSNKAYSLMNELLGFAVCLKNGSKPVFISEGYKIDLETAVSICLLATVNHRQPEALYLADHLSRKEAQKHIS
ncbi:MAG: endonuclease V [Candidatus Thorarchaeota archaeon]